MDYSNSKMFDSLLMLLRTELAGAPSKKNFDDVQWSEVYRLAMDQGVLGLAFDGLRKLCDDGLVKNIDEDLYYIWLGQVMVQENGWMKKLSAAKDLAGVFYDNQLRTMVLKGVSVARLYPNPIHRNSCDLDIFLLDQGSNTIHDTDKAFERGNRVVENLGIEVMRDYYRNNPFTYKELYVENHQYCEYVRTGKNKIKYERLLRTILLEGCTETIDNSHLEAPCPLFTTLFVMNHAQWNFMSGALSLKQVLDLAVLFKAYETKVDWVYLSNIAKEYGRWKLLCAICQIVDEDLGIRVPFEYECNDMLKEFVLKDIRNVRENDISMDAPHRRFHLGKQALRSAWKYKYFSDETMLVSLFNRIVGVIFNTSPKI